MAAPVLRRSVLALTALASLASLGATASCAGGSGTIVASSAELESTSGTSAAEEPVGRSVDDTTPTDATDDTERRGTTTSSRRTGNTTRNPGTSSTSSTPTTSRPGTTSTTKKPTTTTSLPPANPDHSAFCAAFRTGMTEAMAMPHKTEAEKAAQLKVAQALFASLYQTAPDSQKADWKILSDSMNALTPQSPSDDSPAVKAAADRIAEWTRNNCGWDPDEEF